MQRSLEDGPWSFDNNLLILGKLTASDRPSAVPCSNVGANLRSPGRPYDRTGWQMMSDFIGTFMEYDARNASIWNSY